jgi:hypothetical protein
MLFLRFLILVNEKLKNFLNLKLVGNSPKDILLSINKYI